MPSRCSTPPRSPSGSGRPGPRSRCTCPTSPGRAWSSAAATCVRPETGRCSSSAARTRHQGAHGRARGAAARPTPARRRRPSAGWAATSPRTSPASAGRPSWSPRSGDDPAGDTVVQRTSAAGVECRHVVVSPQPTGTYAAVLDESGDLHIAVADMRATDELAVSRPRRRADAARRGRRPGGRRQPRRDRQPWLLSAAAAAGVRSVFEPVSVAKATAAAPVLDGSVRVHTVTPNVDELAALVGHPVDDTVDAVRAAADDLHARGVEHVWVRRGTRGSLLSVARRDEADGPPSHALLVGAPAVEVVDVTGAGDSMTPAFVHALLRRRRRRRGGPLRPGGGRPDLRLGRDRARRPHRRARRGPPDPRHPAHPGAPPG